MCSGQARDAVAGVLALKPETAVLADTGEDLLTFAATWHSNVGMFNCSAMASWQRIRCVQQYSKHPTAGAWPDLLGVTLHRQGGSCGQRAGGRPHRRAAGIEHPH